MLQEATKALNSAFNNSFIKKVSQYLHDCVREEVKSSTFRNLKGDKDNKWIFLKEKHLSLWFIIGFIISISGVTLVCLNGNTELELNPKGDFLALFSAICWGVYSVVISIINRKNYDQICATRRIFFFAVLMMIPLMLFGNHTNIVEGASRFNKPMNVLCLLFLGIIASGFCFAAWNKACKIAGTVKVSCGIYLIPVVTIIPKDLSILSFLRVLSSVAFA